MTKLYGLIGYSLGHSFSEKYFTEKFRRERISGVEYRAFPLENIESLPGLLADNPSLHGFNVTIPYKEQVIPYLDSLDGEAAEIGAVNCVKIEEGKLTGYNTDAYGFRLSLLELIGEDRPSALILGTGGASKAVAYTLGKLGINYTYVSRTPAQGQLSYAELTNSILGDSKLIINTTPLGMSPKTGYTPELPYEAVTSEHYLFDLIYNPAETLFLRQGREQGAATMNGMQMLIAQAERSWEIWETQE